MSELDRGPGRLATWQMHNTLGAGYDAAFVRCHREWRSSSGRKVQQSRGF